MKCRFEIELHPRGKKNSRPIFRNKKTGKSFIGKDKNQHKYEKDAKKILEKLRESLGITKPLNYLLRANFIFYFEEKSRSDLDGLVTMAADLLQDSGIIEDDKLIKYATMEMREDSGFKDKTVIELAPLVEASEVAHPASPGKVSWNEARKYLQTAAQPRKGRR